MLIVFIHIEKTAGTTLNSIFVNSFTHFYSLKEWVYWTNQKNAYFNENEFKNLIFFFKFIKGIGGHTLRNRAGYEKNYDTIKYIAFFRDPIKRYLSHYYYQKHIMKIDWTI